MDNSTQMLNVGLVVLLVLIAFVASRVGFAAYASTFGGQKFGYKFDKGRLSLCGLVVLAVLGLFFVYALIVTKHASVALGYCVGVLPLLIPGCLISVCYVPKDSNDVNKKKG